MSKAAAKWWRDAVIYQIYPSSFKDTNNDGLGDIPGILSKLDYIKSIGVDAIWLCPFYDSPQIDMGYDIADYKKPWAPYGKLEDIEALIKGCHDRNMKVLFDLVINHTSDQHEWFQESRKSKDNPKSDYYIWRDARYDEKTGERMEPTNWRSTFYGSIWQWDESRQQYYLHIFTPEQPDLNFELKEVRDAIYQESMTYWLEKGIDGFRIDTVSLYSKFYPLEDVPVKDPSSKYQDARHKYNEGPRLREFLKEMNAILAKHDAVSIGEFAQDGGWRAVHDYIEESAQMLDLVISFDLMLVDHVLESKFARKWELPELMKITAEWQELILPQRKAWAVNYLENHDQARSVSRYGSDKPEHRANSAKMLALYLLTLSGTTILYQGEEIGHINLDPSVPIEEYKDVVTQNGYSEEIEKGSDQATLDKVKAGAQIFARDHARTPMQWDDSDNGGFSKAKPWMIAAASYKDINVASQEKDEDSVLNFYRKMLKLRKDEKDLLALGEFKLLDPEAKSVFSYTKTSGERTATVFLNFGDQEQKISPPENSKPIIITHAKLNHQTNTLQAYEGRLYISQ